MVASLLRVLERIQRREGRGKGCRCASPWANVARLERIQRREGRGKGCRCASPWVNVGRLVRIPAAGHGRRSDLPGAAAW